MDEQLPIVAEVFDTHWDELQDTGRVMRRPEPRKLAADFRERFTSEYILEAFERAGGPARFSKLMHERYDTMALKLALKMLPQQLNHSGTVNINARVIVSPLSRNLTLDGEATEVSDADANTALGGNDSPGSNPLDASEGSDPPGASDR